MAAKIVQSMAEFSMGDEDWVEYSERFEMYLLANGVTEGDLKRAVSVQFNHIYSGILVHRVTNKYHILDK